VRSIFESLLGLVLGAPRQNNPNRNNDPLRHQAESLLRYWMDCELYDLPSIPKGSKAPEDFVQAWAKPESKLRQSKKPLKEESRVLFMFQTHIAGYIYDGADVGPNAEVPKTYLAAIGLQPKLNPLTQTIEWKLSENSDEESIFNLAAMRTLYRRQKPKEAERQTLQEWTKSRLEFLKSLFETAFKVEEGEPGFSTETLYGVLKDVNRRLASEFWPDENSKNYITSRAKPLAGTFSQADKSYESQMVKGIQGDEERIPTFRWRHSFQEDGLETVQIGPFFVNDLAKCLDILQDRGLSGLSKPLRRYLFGYEQATGRHQSPIPINPIGKHNTFRHLVDSIPLGRWPDNPQHGLSLFQCVAVSLGISTPPEHSVVAVNGPPGTGKTTLLKEVIADKFVKRTSALFHLYQSDKDGWYNTEECRRIILDNSIIVASSNNKAVENISKELPSKAKVWAKFEPEHFTEVCKDEDWGLFCAVLGNKSNRREFSRTLLKLSKHLSIMNDRFAMNAFRDSLSGVKTEKRGSTIERYLLKLVENDRAIDFINDVKKLAAYRKDELHWLMAFLDSVVLKRDSSSIIIEINALDEQEWETRYISINNMVKQWFGAKHDERHWNEQSQSVGEAFERCQSNVIQSISDRMKFNRSYSDDENWSCYSSESKEEAIERILMRSEFGDESENTCRSELFVESCRLNEVLVASARKAIKDDLSLVVKLLEGDTSELDSISIEKAWSSLFLFFPVMSSSLASIQNQLNTVQDKEMFGMCMVDEAGQAINYHVVGLMQRCKKTILVGDPIQVEPVVTTPKEVDRLIAEEFLSQELADKFSISMSSAQTIADKAGEYYSIIGDRIVGLPLLIHRRCLEPMFSIANEIAYANRMINANGDKPKGIGSLMIDTSNVPINQDKVTGYKNTFEAHLAIQLMEYLSHHDIYIEEEVFVITPFKEMERELKRLWSDFADTSKNRDWMKRLLTQSDRERFEMLETEMKHKDATKMLKDFASSHIGTVHTFQGKEATTVIICLAATNKAKKGGGITWVNKTPNLLNVAVTRAKKYVHVVGNRSDWLSGKYSKTVLESNLAFISLNDGNASLLDELTLLEEAAQDWNPSSGEYEFDDDEDWNPSSGEYEFDDDEDWFEEDPDEEGIIG